jgi:hypothetical protein
MTISQDAVHPDLSTPVIPLHAPQRLRQPTGVGEVTATPPAPSIRPA